MGFLSLVLVGKTGKRFIKPSPLPFMSDLIFVVFERGTVSNNPHDAIKRT